ncbi:CLUMA_CG018234, isoform A [Clunio marinus]|uniref:CLUMA_CG018234, isoform A n=1 Tax=Clunio marinus TaxID=568069 RepID=A0A1J1IZG3_9DIPT|nr:CLUMA_CG018234, isoform A [Clunio marinus]
MGVAFVFLAFVAIFAGIMCFMKNYRKIQLDIPAPNALPIIGHAHLMIGLNNEEQLKLITELCFLYPNLVKVWFLHIMGIIVNSPELIQKVFNSDVCMEKPYIAYKLFNLDNGLLSSRYPKWKHDRRFFNNSFKISTLQSFIPIFIQTADKLTNEIASFVDGNSFNILDYTIRCTLKMICSTSLGMNISDAENDETFNKVFHAVDTSETVAMLQNKPLVYPDTIFKLTPRYYENKRQGQYLKDFHQRIIDERREILKNNNNCDEKDLGYNIFIDHILNNEGMFSDEDIQHHVITVLSAGYETSATATAHCILFLAQHQNVQNRMVEEINEVYATDDEITFESLGKLQYMDRVIKETLRVAPVGPVIFREAMDDFEIEQGLVIPKGTTFVLNIFALHRRRDIWGEKADLFNPDHFLPENVAKRHPCSYIPFSTGRRNCIGHRYAMISMKIILLKLLKTYKFSTELNFDDLRFKAVLTLKLIGEHAVSIVNRY